MEEIRITPDDAGQRLDRFLRKYLKGAALPTVYKLIRTRQVTVNGKKAKPQVRLEVDDLLSLYFADRRLTDLRGPEQEEKFRPPPEVTVLYEDNDVLALAKPPFLLVHTGQEEDEPTLMDFINARFVSRGAKTFRPALAHRLDRLTSGVVLVGKSAEGLRGLTEAIRRGKVKKIYLALVSGELPQQKGEIRAPLLREDRPGMDRPKVRVDPREGKRAVTRYEVIAESRGLSLLRVRLMTGRTHQIRVHLRYLRCPVVGDPVYGNRDLNQLIKGRHGLWRQWLHAREVALRHPVTGVDLHIKAPLPRDLVAVLKGEDFPREAYE
jgi:23S rRNA pseudouridine955/2504/2580 synthase